MSPVLRLLILLAALWAGYYWVRSPGSVAVAAPDGTLAYPGYTISPLERWQPTARILSVRRYRSDREAELAPLDLALGWDRMADPTLLAGFDISQRNRWFYWRTDKLPFSRAEIQSSMANVHIVPATQHIANQLKDLRAGQRVVLDGQLISIQADDGWRWRSSLSRTDTGRGSCELLWLEGLTLLSG